MWAVSSAYLISGKSYHPMLRGWKMWSNTWCYKVLESTFSRGSPTGIQLGILDFVVATTSGCVKLRFKCKHFRVFKTDSPSLARQLFSDRVIPPGSSFFCVLLLIFILWSLKSFCVFFKKQFFEILPAIFRKPLEIARLQYRKKLIYVTEVMNQIKKKQKNISSNRSILINCHNEHRIHYSVVVAFPLEILSLEFAEVNKLTWKIICRSFENYHKFVIIRGET